MNLKRGDVLMVDLKPRSGSEQSGLRPAVLISDDRFNRAEGWASLIVIPLSTSHAQARRGPTAVPIPGGAGGLSQDGVALCHQITTIDRSKVHERLGRLPRALMVAIEGGVRAALDLE